MLRFYAEQFIAVCNRLSMIVQILSLAEQQGQSLDALIKPPPEWDFEWLHNTLIALKLPMSAMSAERLLNSVKSETELKRKTLLYLTNDVLGRLKDELSTRFIFMVSADKEPFYDSCTQASLSKSDFVTKFPDMIEDLSEAGNCFALERYTACVFHLMRIMEKAVQKFADRIGLSMTSVCDKEWQVILNEMRGQLNSLHP